MGFNFYMDYSSISQTDEKMSILYHCYNKNGDKISVTGKELQDLAKRGDSSTMTMMIERYRGVCLRITFYTFSEKGELFYGNCQKRYI